MFDCIRFDCEFILPELQDMTFQTKDFYKMLDNYVVSKEGRLFLEKATYFDVPLNERPYFVTDDWEKNPFVQLIGATGKNVADKILVRHSGIISFNGFSISIDGQDMFYEFEAGFQNGVLQFITLMEERPLENETF